MTIDDETNGDDAQEPESVTGKGKGKGNPGRTPEDEYDARVAATVTLLANGHRKSAIKRTLAKQFGVSARTCENYLSRAREILLEDIREERDEQRAMSLAVYRGVITNPNTTVKDKLRAQHRIDKLLGLETPTRVAITDTEGRDIPVGDGVPAIAFESMTVEQLKIVKQARAMVRAAVAGTIDGTVVGGVAGAN